MTLRVFTRGRTRLVLKWGSSVWESFHFHLWEFIFVKKLFVVVNVELQFLSSIPFWNRKPFRLHIVYCERKIYDGGGGSWEYQKPLWFLHVAFRWIIILQEEVKLDVSTLRSLGNLNILLETTEKLAVSVLSY